MNTKNEDVRSWNNLVGILFYFTKRKNKKTTLDMIATPNVEESAKVIFDVITDLSCKYPNHTPGEIQDELFDALSVLNIQEHNRGNK